MSNETLINVASFTTEDGPAGGAEIHSAVAAQSRSAAHSKFPGMNSLNYVAPTSAGHVGLTLRSDQPIVSDRSAMSKRLALGKVERLVRCVEDWIGIALDLAPIDTLVSSPHLVTICQRDKPQIKMDVYLPLALLHQIENTGQLDESSISFVWPVCFAKLVFGDFAISEDECALLDNNSTVLVPESFNPEWTPTLVIPAIDGLLDGQFDLSQSLWTPGAAYKPYTENGNADVQNRRVELAAYCHFTTRECIGSNDRLAAMVNKQLQERDLSLDVGEDVEVSGVLIAVGVGAGLHITRFLRNAETARQ